MDAPYGCGLPLVPSKIGRFCGQLLLKNALHSSVSITFNNIFFKKALSTRLPSRGTNIKKVGLIIEILRGETSSSTKHSEPCLDIGL